MRLSVLLFLACLSVLSIVVLSDTIVSDNYGNVVTLPLTGGNATGGYTVANPAVPTSPYVLQVFINDVNEGPSFPGTAQEIFFISPGTPLFGNATLISMNYRATPASSPQNTSLGTVSNPNTAVGIYTYTFTIPVSGVITVNMNYTSVQNPTEVDKIFIQVANPLSVQIVGDPQFVGLRGQSYQVHGIDGTVYNIITEKNTQINSRFVFLTEGKCPILNGVPSSNCWSHPGSYLGDLSFQQVVDGKLHQSLVTAGNAKNGFSLIQMDGKDLQIGEVKSYGSFSLSYESTHHVIISTENYTFDLSNSDMFINIAVTVKTTLSKLTAHGLLGQTHSTKVYPTSLRYIEGTTDDYIIDNNDIFGTGFPYNQFNL